MSTPKYDALVAKVRDWANRDSTVLSDAIISDFIDYSADLCYRELRIPPLEYTYQYAAITVAGEDSLQLPPDVTEIMMFRVTDSAGKSLVFDQKMDMRSFTDKNTTKEFGSFTRKGSNLEFYPDAAVGDVYELHYYRRLSDMDSVYIVNAANIAAGNTTTVTEGIYDGITGDEITAPVYTGNEVYNWLRDDNERMVLWGALHHAFEYLGSDDQAAKYLNKQMQAIDELNREEKKRRVSGASNTVTYEVSELL